jgi:hypothetical protein
MKTMLSASGICGSGNPPKGTQTPGLAADEVVPDTETLGLGDEVLLAADALVGIGCT